MHYAKRMYRSLPKTISSKVDVVRSYHQCVRNRNYPVFIHIPKNAGTSVSQCIYGKAIQHLTYDQIVNTFGRNFIERREVFAFIRDPLDRFVSAINYLATNGSVDAPATKTPVNDLIYKRGINWFIRYWSENEFKIYDQVLNPQCMYVQENCMLYAMSEINTVLEKYGVEQVLYVNKSKNIFQKRDINTKNIDLIISYYQNDYRLLQRLSK